MASAVRLVLACAAYLIVSVSSATAQMADRPPPITEREPSTEVGDGDGSASGNGFDQNLGQFVPLDSGVPR
jgi:hypothetical protein